MCSMPPKPMANELPEEYLYYAICVTGITALLVTVYNRDFREKNSQ